MSEAEVTTLEAEAASVLAAAGEKWTPLRAMVFAILRESPRPVSAYDVTETVCRAKRKRTSASSIYRILYLLVAHNLAYRIEKSNAFAANRKPLRSAGHGLLVCDLCGSVDPLGEAGLEVIALEAARSLGFRPSSSLIELHGRCRDCQQSSLAGGAGT